MRGSSPAPETGDRPRKIIEIFFKKVLQCSTISVII